MADEPKRSSELIPRDQQAERTLSTVHGKSKSIQTSNGESFRVATLDGTDTPASLRQTMRETLSKVLPDLVSSLETASFKDKTKLVEVLARYGVGSPEDSTHRRGDSVQQVVVIPSLGGQGGG